MLLDESNLLPRRRGNVLLLTLVLLALCSLSLAGVGRAAIARVEAADEAQVDLQRHWGVLSCSAALLPKTEELLYGAELAIKQPTWSYHYRLNLGNQQFDLIFGDESAKVNIAALVQRQGREQAELTIRRLSLGSRAAGSVHLRSPGDQFAPQCFGDVFVSASPHDLCESSMGYSPAELLSCWGDGSLNIHRASETVMREACSGILNLSQIHLLAQLQKTDLKITLDGALDQLKLSSSERVRARWALVDASKCHSLWINCRTARRSYWSLDIADQSQMLVPRLWHFEW